MKKDNLIDLFLEKRYLLDMGAGSLSKRYKTTIENIKEIKKNVRKLLKENNSLNEDIYKVKLNDNCKYKLPKILILDIETAPLKAFVWKLWKEDIYIDRIISDWFCISWSAKWLYGASVMSDVLNSGEILLEDDYRIMKNLWNLIQEADIIITHNGKKFDIPRINTRFILHGFPPSKPYLQIDTKEQASKLFSFSSNKLDYLAKQFGFDQKLETTFELWKKCLEGDEESLDYMVTYNIHDVELLEEIYLKMRPYIKSHPNVGLYFESNESVCTHCGSNELIHESEYYTRMGIYDVYRCSCGALSRVRKSKKVNNNMLSVAQ